MDFDYIFTCVILFVSLKSITIGSDFSFYSWFKYGKRYTDWYFDKNRTTFYEEN